MACTFREIHYVSVANKLVDGAVLVPHNISVLDETRGDNSWGVQCLAFSPPNQIQVAFIADSIEPPKRTFDAFF